jgi:hypothetical protein
MMVCLHCRSYLFDLMMKYCTRAIGRLTASCMVVEWLSTQTDQSMKAPGDMASETGRVE